MQISPLLIVILCVACVAGGYVFRMLDSRVTSALKEGREPDPAAEAAKPVQKLDEHGVLRITVDPALKWHLELDGTPLEPDGMTAEQRARLVNVVVQIRPWIDGKTVAAPTPPPVAPTVAPASGSALALSPTTPLVPGLPAAPETAKRLDVARGFRSLLENEFTKPEAIKGPSIVGLIDQVLQQKLVNSPLAGHRIRLEEGSLGEVIVFVGIARYSGVDAVPDEQIKAIIRESIAEWDRKTIL